MATERYLVDTSVFARLTKPPVAAVVTPLASEGRIVLCLPVVFELGFATRNAEDYARIAALVDAFRPVPTTDADQRRALEVQAALATSGRHRGLSLVDALVAAVAEARELLVLHYDRDFELIAQVTGQGHRWVVAPGTAD